MMKKLLSLALCLLLCLLACAALADTEYDEGFFRFAVNEETGEATVLKLLENYVVVKVPDAVMGHPVTAVGKHAFYEAQRLETVYLPDTIQSIGDYAFAGCPELKTVTMGAALTTIGEGAFTRSGLRQIELPEGVTTVGKRAFADCDSLYVAVLPGSLSVIPEEMFTGCRFLNAVTLKEGLTVIGDKAFCGCAMTEIKLPATVTELGVNPFIGCLKLAKISSDSPAFAVEQGGLIDVANATLVSYAIAQKACGYTIPAGVKCVGVGAFSQSNLQEVTVPDGVEAIGDYAFWYCTDLKTAFVADSVTNVHPTAFAECYGLTNLRLPAGVEVYMTPVDPMQ